MPRKGFTYTYLFSLDEIVVSLSPQFFPERLG